MKQLIEKLSIGEKEYEKPSMVLDIEEVSFFIEAGKTERRSFFIKSLSGQKLKGIIFATSEHINIENNQFVGVDNEIVYTVSAKNLYQGDEIRGSIDIISNGGEISIPVKVTVEAKGIKSSVGTIKNMFHFANLAQTNFDEALRMFEKEEFPKYILGNDLHLRAVYYGLMGSSDMNTSLEEFLVATNKKRPVHISISKEIQEYRNLEEDYGDKIVVIKDTWGYVNIKIDVIGGFIETHKKRLSSNDFAGSNYELTYCIRKEKLCAGKNEGKLRFNFNDKYIDFDIIVYEPDAEAERKEKQKIVKKARCEIFRNYLDFRLRKIDSAKWEQQTQEAIVRARSTVDSMDMKLFQAQLFINNGRESDGAWLLENVAEELLPVKEENIDLYCYYLYIRTLQKRDDDFIAEVIKKVRDYYENGYASWVLLWILMYLDESYEENPSKKLIRIKEQFRKGMRSPLMYFEAIVEFNKMPEMLRVLEDFEIQVINFGIKNNCVKRKLALQINDIVSTEKRVNPLIYNALDKLYKKYESKEIVESLCSLLIKAGYTEHKYFKWFKQGVEDGLKITRLYEYFMFSVSLEYQENIPQIVMMYFSYNASMLPEEKRDFLYANVIGQKEENPQIYEAYKPQMEKYVADCILTGHINKFMAVVYEDMLTNAMINSEIADRLPEILNSYEIRCEDDRMREVIVVHKELGKIEKYPIVGNRAYVYIHTDDEAVVFEDVTGKRHCSTVKYDKNKLLNMDKYFELCYEMVPDNESLVRYYGDGYLKYNANREKGITVLCELLKLKDIEKEYREFVEKEVVDYYDSFVDGRDIEAYILNTNLWDFGEHIRIRITEIAIARGMYERAYELISHFGYEGIEIRTLMKCVAKLIEDGTHENERLLNFMSSYVFSKGKYNETILNYLSEYFYGKTKDMMDIWAATKDFECDDKNLEEKIIVQMLFTDAYVGREGEIFESYYNKHPDKKVKKAYLFSKSYDYFVKEIVVDEKLFSYIRTELLNGEKLCDVTELAYLHYMSKKESIPEAEFEICRDMIYDLTRVGKVFEFFKTYKKYFRIPYEIIDRTIVEYRTRPTEKVYIHFYDNNSCDKNEYKVDEMKKICDGVYTYSFLIFYDEKVQYYITEDGSDDPVTESMELSVSEVDFSNDDTHYGLINDMLVCRQMNEEKTLGDMAKDYYIRKIVGENVFTII